jgi:hypothetical protein
MAELRDLEIAGKTLLLGISVMWYQEEIHIEIGELSMADGLSKVDKVVDRGLIHSLCLS